MKQIIFIFLFLAALTTNLQAKVLDFFTAKSDNNVITLEWRSSDESNISRYEIERSSEKNPGFSLIETVYSDGSSKTRKYVDEEAYLRKDNKTDKIEQKTTYTYRIKVVYKDNSFKYSDSVNISPTINNIRRTWGMIKEMFR